MNPLSWVLRGGRSWLRWARPVRYEDCLRLEQDVRRYIQVYATASVLLMFGGILTTFSRPLEASWKAWGAVLLMACVALVGFGMIRRGRKAASMEWGLTVMILSSLSIVALGPWFAQQEMEHMVFMALFAPLILGAFVPFRPMVMAILGLCSCSILIGGVALTEPMNSWVISARFWICFPVVGGAMLMCQVKRRFWASLHQEERSLFALERLSEQSKRTAGVAHGIKSPMATTLNSLQEGLVLCEELAESIGHEEVEGEDLLEILQELQEVHERALGGTLRMNRFLDGLVDSRAVEKCAERKTVRVRGFVREILEELVMLGRCREGEVSLEEINGGLFFMGEVGLLRQVLLNLLHNALDATEGRTGVRVWCRSSGGGGWLEVCDCGEGVSPEIQKRIFEPMFTTKIVEARVGLGLSVARDIARGSMQGELLLRREDTRTCFRLESAQFTFVHSLRSYDQASAFSPPQV